MAGHLGDNPIKIPLIPVKKRIETYEMDVGETDEDRFAERVFISTLLDKDLYIGDNPTNEKAEFVTIETKVPHGIQKSGTQVVLENFGPSSGLRTVYVEGPTTLTMKRKKGEESQPVPNRNARLYVPYTNSTTGFVQYTKGPDGRPAKSSRQCAKREAYDQCEKMPNKNERTYTMLEKKCSNRIAGGACMSDSQCRNEFRKKGFKTFNRAKCEGENLSVDARKRKEGQCALYETVSCGFARHFAGVGPSDYGTSYITKALTSTAKLHHTGKECKSSTCVIPGSGEILNEGGVEFCNASKANCETCQREGSESKGKWKNKPLTSAKSVKECADACANDLECRFFLFDKPNGQCFVESTDSAECIEGLQDAGVDMFELVLAEKDVGCSRFGKSCCPEAHVRAKGDASMKCAFQEPLPDGSNRLQIVNPGDPLSVMCEEHAVQTLKENALMKVAAGEEKDEFMDMQNKNSHIKIQMAKNASTREELDNGCCDAQGENCGCPYVEYPVYYQAYEDSEDDAVPASARLLFPIGGCDAWNDVEEEMVKGNLNGSLDVKKTLQKKGVTTSAIAEFESKYQSNILHGSYRLACEAGWRTRKCEKYAGNALELSACRSGAYLRSVGGALDYNRGRTLDLATADARDFLENMGTSCDASAAPNAPNFCKGVCINNKCMQCSADETCRTKYGSEYVCRPFVDTGREILYDGHLMNEPHLRHSFEFKTCQRKDRHEADVSFLKDSAFAATQKIHEARMKAAKSRAMWISGFAILVILIAVILRARKR